MALFLYPFLDTLFFSLLYRLYPCFYRYIYSTLARNSSHLSHFIFHYLRDGINTYCFLLLSSTYRYILYFTSIWFALFTFYFLLFERRFKLLLCFYFSLFIIWIISLLLYSYYLSPKWLI